jgi:hypothetical protein
VKRTGRGESVGIVIHICMGTTRGNALCSYLYLKLAKPSCFSFYLFYFFFYKIREQDEVWLAPVGGGRWQVKG